MWQNQMSFVNSLGISTRSRPFYDHMEIYGAGAGDTPYGSIWPYVCNIMYPLEN